MGRYLKFLFLLYCALWEARSCADALGSAREVAFSAMRAQSERLKVVSQNLANAESLNPAGTPYRRKTIAFRPKMDREADVAKVDVLNVGYDNTEFEKRFDPSHFAADKDGYVSYPNVNKTIELMDAKEAQMSYETNLRSYEISKDMSIKALDLLR